MLSCSWTARKELSKNPLILKSCLNLSYLKSGVTLPTIIRQAFLDKMGLEQLTPKCSDRGAMAWSEVEIRDPLLDMISYIWSGEVVPNHTY